MRKILLLLVGTTFFWMIVLAAARPSLFLSAEASQKPILIKAFGHPDKIVTTKTAGDVFCSLTWKKPEGVPAQLWGVPKKGCKVLSALRLGYFKFGKAKYYQAFLQKKAGEK